MAAPKGTRPPAAGKGRAKGSQNKTTTALKEAVLMAAQNVGRDDLGKNGMVGYLERLAIDEPVAFSGLLGKVLPMQIAGDGGGAIVLRWEQS